MTKKKPTKNEIEKLTKKISERGSLIQFLFTTAIQMKDEPSDKVAVTLLSIYTMGYISGMGYDEGDVVGMMKKDKEVN